MAIMAMTTSSSNNVKLCLRALFLSASNLFTFLTNPYLDDQNSHRSQANLENRPDLNPASITKGELWRRGTVQWHHTIKSRLTS